jgi:hypothetical protein
MIARFEIEIDLKNNFCWCNNIYFDEFVFLLEVFFKKTFLKLESTLRMSLECAS